MAHLSVGLKKLTSESVRVGSFEICSFYVFGGPIIPVSEMDVARTIYVINMHRIGGI